MSYRATIPDGTFVLLFAKSGMASLGDQQQRLSRGTWYLAEGIKIKVSHRQFVQ